MTGITRSVVLSTELDRQVLELSKKLGLGRSQTMRMLMARALGQGMARLYVDEKVQEVKNLLRKRFFQVLNEGLRQELHALVDEVDPPTVGPLVSESEFEPVVEPEIEAEEPAPAPMKGRPRKAAKARRR